VPGGELGQDVQPACEDRPWWVVSTDAVSELDVESGTTQVNSDHSSHQGALTLTGHPQGPAESHSPLCTVRGSSPHVPGYEQRRRPRSTKTGTAQSIWAGSRCEHEVEVQDGQTKVQDTPERTGKESRRPPCGRRMGPAEATASTARSARISKPPGGNASASGSMAQPNQQFPAESYLNLLSPKVYVAHLGQQKLTL
jgi:hypothetical protein